MLAQTQNTNLNFGNPTTEEMNMTSCSLEPNASAVVLCRLDDVNYEIRDGGFCVVYEIKERIKILKPEGKDYANVSISYVDFQGNLMTSRQGRYVDEIYHSAGEGGYGHRIPIQDSKSSLL